MALTQLAPPYPIFTDKNGDPLDSGYIYLGEANKNPETNPIQVYYDSAFTQPAAQPLRTSNGYIMRNGSPASIYAQSVFSVTVRDKSNAFVIYAPVGYSQTLEASEIVYNEGSTGAVDRTVENRLRDFASVKDFGAVGDGVANDLAEIQAAVDNGPNAISVPKGTYDLGGGTLTLPAGSSLLLDGGVLTNGTIACDGNFFFGARGLSESITLTGTVANEDGVFFDWFTCEKATKASYDTFINGNNATYGSSPSISSVNRTILQMLVLNGHVITFGGGIYPFDDEMTVAATFNFRIKGQSKDKTLLWAPTSSLIHITLGGAIYPWIKDIRIEVYGNILHTNSWTVNAIHGLEMTDSYLLSYSDHTFYNDRTTTGGTGCPIYGTLVKRCAVYAGPDKAVFRDWRSGSNIYDNVVDAFQFFNGYNTNKKGVMRSFFWNSNVRRMCHSNISYSGFQYVAYYDEAGLWNFIADNNVFEIGASSYDAIVRADAGSNFYLTARDNYYIGAAKGTAPNGVTGLHYVMSVGNLFVDACDSPTPIFTNTLKNTGPTYLRYVTDKIDVGSTKFRLGWDEPYSYFNATSGDADLYTASTDLSERIGLGGYYTTYSSDISYIVSRRSVTILDNLAGKYGSTAARPTIQLYIGYHYFDTTLGKPIWYNGTGWVDATGASV